MTNRTLISIALAASLHSIALAQNLLREEVSWDSMFRGPGKISLRVDPFAFSPNNDGKQDSAFFFLGTQGVSDLSKWAIVLENSRGRTVRRFTGKGTPPGLTEWNGSNNKHAPLPEGVYTAKAYIWGRGGRTASPKIQLALDNTPPRLNVALSTASFSPSDPAGSATISLRAEDNVSPARWTCAIFVKSHFDVEVFTASGAFAGGQASLAWDGLNAQTGQTVPNGAYSVRATAQDEAGNETTAPPVDIEVVVRPESVLKQLSDTLDVQTTPGGMQFTVPSARIFTNQYSDDLSDESLTLRQQLLYLVQSHPDHAVLLEGRSGSEKSVQGRADLSSAQAWALYSFLVKSGVSATRLSVQGLGGARGEKNQIVIRLQNASPPPEPQRNESPLKSPDKSALPIKNGATEVIASSSPIPSDKTGVHP